MIRIGRWVQGKQAIARARCFTVLAMESSADDTAAAVVTSSGEILSNVVIKQNHLHQVNGGIHPGEAVIAHQRNMPNAIRKALSEAKMNMNSIDGIAFTRGPGMGGCLSVCLSAAKNLAAALDKPIVGVHHMQAHALTPLLTEFGRGSAPQFPFITLLVSGGHTLLLLAQSNDSFRILATTSDSSIGRAIDKTARGLGLEWGAYGLGAALEDFCRDIPDEENLPAVEPLPQPLHKILEFSFAGPYSHMQRIIETNDMKTMDIRMRQALARSFQTGIFRQLEDKLILALELCEKEGISVRHVVVSGGVASNMFLRNRLQTRLDNTALKTPVSLVFPPPSLCTDNAVMIAWASMHRFLAGSYDPYDIDMRIKWDITDLS